LGCCRVGAVGGVGFLNNGTTVADNVFTSLFYVEARLPSANFLSDGKMRNFSLF
jgi:hypothetical protein